MTNNNQVQPIFIMPEDTKRTTGRNAQRNNIMAARLVAETVRTTLGPKGMDKMLVDPMGDIIVTNDGVTILREMQIEHPAAKMIIEVAKTQEEEVGDGTTTAVVLAGELLKKAEHLLDQEIHPTIISRGYRIAAEYALEVLEKISEPVSEKDDALLRKISQTSLTGKGAESAKEELSNVIVKAVKRVLDHDEQGNASFDKNNIKIEKKAGGRIEQTELIEGIVIEKEAVHSQMPKTIVGAKIALIDSPIEIKDTEIDAKIQITDPSQMQAFLDQEENMLRAMVDKIAIAGANVVFCQKGIDDMAQHFLAKHGIYACRRVKKSDVEAIARATGARIVTNLDDLTGQDLGRAGRVDELKSSDEEFTYITGCKNPKSVTLMVRGGTEHIADEIKRAVDDAIGDVAASIKVGKVVGGAGSSELEVSKELRKFADSLSGREQLAVLAFADSLESIPRTLAENAGMDPIDIITELKAAHEKKQIWAGVNVEKGKVMDAWKAGVIEPLKIKTQAISSASEVAQMILRIDDVIAAGGAGQMPHGMSSNMQ
jgi:thermosome